MVNFEDDFTMVEVIFEKKNATTQFPWLVVSTHLKNISQNGNLPQIGMKIKHIWNHHLDNFQFL